MDTKSSNFKPILITLIFLIALLITQGYFRFKNLGYSSFSVDEVNVMLPFKNRDAILDQNFLDKNKKGPIQFFIPKIMGLTGAGVYNEYAHRLPFAIAGMLSIVVLFVIVLELTKSPSAAFIAASLFGVNGLIVALTRIVQYQSLNMLFSLLALLLFIYYRKTQKVQFAIAGGVLFSISFLTHWDAILFIPILAWLMLSKKNLKHVMATGLVILMLCSSYAIPFYIHMRGSADKQSYFSKRVGVSTINLDQRLTKLRFTYELYNPFVSVYVLLIVTALCILLVRKYPEYLLWHIAMILFYVFLVKSAGTHIYNILISLSICLGLVLGMLQKALPRILSFLPILPFLPVLVFLTHQSNILFIDNKREYPWETEKITEKYVTRKFKASDIPNFKLGFTYFRDYELVRSELERRFPDYNSYTFVTNDYKGVLRYYFDLNHKATNKMFIIGVKNPFTFVTDYRFGQYRKTALFNVRNDYGHTVMKLYTGQLKEKK